MKPDSTVLKPGCTTSGLCKSWGKFLKLTEVQLVFFTFKRRVFGGGLNGIIHISPIPIRCDSLKACLVKMKTGLNTVTSGVFCFFLIYVSVGLEE